MLAPHSGQTRLRIAEIKLMLVFLTTANEIMMDLPFLAAILRRRMHRTLSAGLQARFGEGAADRGCGTALRIHK
jgi:hypothetical protein